MDIAVDENALWVIF